MSSSQAQLKQEFEAIQTSKARGRALLALSNLAKTADGQEALWYILDHTGFMVRELWTAGVEINRRVSFRDFGSWLMHELVEANDVAFFQMQQEFWRRTVKERIEYENFVKENS